MSFPDSGTLVVTVTTSGGFTGVIPNPSAGIGSLPSVIYFPYTGVALTATVHADIHGDSERSAVEYMIGASIYGELPISGVLVYGCTNPLATNYNPLAAADNGSCVFPVGVGPGGGGGTGPGCMNPLAINYNSAATSDNGSCILPVLGCTIAGSLNYNPSANVDNGSCIRVIPGCTVPGAINYNPLANKDDGSGVFPFAYPDGPPPPDLCVWSGDLLPACAWTWSDTFAAPPQTPAQILRSTYYGIGNVALLLGNEPL